MYIYIYIRIYIMYIYISVYSQQVDGHAVEEEVANQTSWRLKWHT